MFIRQTLTVVLLAVFGSVASAQQYKLDTAHTSIYFKVTHQGLSYVYGRFNNMTGGFTLGEKPSFNITVEAGSIDTGNEKRDAHLKSADFFNVKQFPVITFKSTAVDVSGDTYKVTGDITLHGVTKSITVELTRMGEIDRRGKKVVGFDTTFTLNRMDYSLGEKFGSAMLGEEVTMMISFEGEAGE